MTPAISPQVQLVTFRLGDETFAADVFSVERVLEYQAPRKVPGAPEWIEGVIEYQGRVVPAIGLRKRFEVPAQSASAANRILVFSVGNTWIAAIVDSVREVRTVSADALAAPPEIFRGLPCEFVKGILREGDALTIYLDIARILSTLERIIVEEIATGKTTAT